MKKASNNVEAYRVFDSQRPLKRDQREFYVELYKKNVKKLQTDLILNSNPRTSFFVTGQAGNGKSTAFTFLLEGGGFEKYDVKYINGRDLLNLDDVDIIDVILMIGYTVVKGDKAFESRYLSELEKMRKVKLGRLEEEEKKSHGTTKGAGVGTSFSAVISLLKMIQLKGSVFANWKIEKEKRKVIREIFTLDKLELIGKINEIIAEYSEKVLKGGKTLLIIVDDLEKMRDIKQINELFVENFYMFGELNCTKIITFPVYLANQHAMFQNASMFGIRIKANPNEESENGDIQKNVKLLKDVIYRRLEVKKIVREDAADRAVKYSGGNPRFLLEIMQKAVRNTIDLENPNAIIETTPGDVDVAVEDISSLASLAAMNRLKVLKHVREHHRGPDGDVPDETFIRSIQDNTVFAYFNGAPWYDLNPIIKKSVDAYIAHSERNDE